MQWVPWQDAGELAAATAATWTATARSRRVVSRALLPWARELTLVLILYSAWQYAGAWSIGRRSAAIGRGRAVWDVERALRLPSERTFQSAFLGHPDVLRVLNGFYAFVHVPALAVCLVWLFVRHRDRYPPVRTTVAILTGACLAIQMVPVAPPRLIPDLHVVDTGAAVGPYVYARGAPGIDQLSAMPSLHVGWALVVAGAVVFAGRGRWRWAALAYPVMTMIVVVATGNHYWADGIVAAALAVPAVLVSYVMYRPRAAEPVDVGVAELESVPAEAASTSS